MWYYLFILFKIDNFSFSAAFLVSIEESIDDSEEIENENEKTPMSIKIIHIILKNNYKII